jgi:hypothetical protein
MKNVSQSVFSWFQFSVNLIFFSIISTETLRKKNLKIKKIGLNCQMLNDAN